MISVEPPPISKISAPWYLRPIRGAQPSGGQVGFLFRRDHLEVDARFVTGARDQDIGIGGQARRLGGDGAHMADADAWRCARRRFSARRWCGRWRRRTDSPVWLTPSPSRTMREKESTTRKPSPARRGARSEAGNCWCPDPAPPAAGRPGSFAATANSGGFRAILPCAGASRADAEPSMTGAKARGEAKGPEKPVCAKPGVLARGWRLV